MEEPKWSDTFYPPINFQDLCYYSEPKQSEYKNKRNLDEVDPHLLDTFQKLGMPLTTRRDWPKMM